jgi:hypothetical protein
MSDILLLMVFSFCSVFNFVNVECNETSLFKIFIVVEVLDFTVNQKHCSLMCVHCASDITSLEKK